MQPSAAPSATPLPPAAPPAAAPYAELSSYLARIPAPDRTRDRDALRARMLAARTLSARVKALAFALKIASTPALLLGLAALAASAFAPATVGAGGAVLALQVVEVALLAKLFLPLVDLETRYLQFVAIALLAALFAWSNPQPLVPIATGGFFAVLCFTSRHARHAAKLRTLAWLMRDPDRAPGDIAALERETTDALAAAGVPLFDDPAYVRTFEVKGKGSARKTSLVDTNDRDAPPPKGHVRVEIWRRDPRRDLSALREFFVCCFLGGSQDASAFDFLLSRSVTMLDFVSPKGRTLRAFLLAAREKDLGPVLIVDAVFGRDGGLVGSAAEDDAFVREQVEAYARFAGFRHVLIATTPTNRRPRLFLESLDGPGVLAPKASLRLALFTRTPLKVEVFNRVRGRSLYWMLLAEIFNATDAYGTRGRIRGRWLAGGDDDPEARAPIASPPRPAGLEARTRATVIALDPGLSSDTVRLLLDGFLERIPGMDGAGAPSRVEVRTGAPDEPPSGDGWTAPLVLAPNASPDPFVREVDVAVSVMLALLRRLHPRPIDALEPAFDALPALEERFLASSSAFRAVQSLRPFGEWIPWGLCARVLRRRYDATRVFKAKELHAWIAARPPEEQGELPHACRAFLAEKAETYEGFRDKFLGAIPAETREAILDAMTRPLVEIARKLPFSASVPALPSPGEEDEALARVDALEKEAARLGIALPEAVAAEMTVVRARAKRLQQIAEIEGMLAHKKEKAALAAMAGLSARAPELTPDDRARLRALARKARAAPFDRLVERLNVDGLF